MEKIIIDGKEHKCSKAIKEHIVMLESKVKAAISLAGKIEDEMDEMDSDASRGRSKIFKLINETKHL